MRVSPHLAAAAALALFGSAAAQTYSKCDPIKGQSCAPDPALGGSASIDFTSGASSDFEVQGDTVSYGSEGASFTISQSGDSPQIVSKWYIMFGKVDIVMKAAPGTGIVSSAVLQSDDLDEIDWEWLGYQPTQVQTNYFGKGITGSYDRGLTVTDSTSQSDFNTYTIDWSAEETLWQINGKTVRTLTPETAETNQYPQTPMQVKIGAWSGGDPSNAQGTISWAGGPTDYSAGPYTMYVQSVSVQDYSTGKSYSYDGTSGAWQDITASGGTVYSGGPKAGSAPVSGDPEPASESAAPESAAPTKLPYTTLVTSPSSTMTTYPGLPSGWTVLSSGKVVPPSSAPHHHHAAATSVPSSLPQHSDNTGEPEPKGARPVTHALLPASTPTSKTHQPKVTPYTGAASKQMVGSGVAACAALCAALLL